MAKRKAAEKVEEKVEGKVEVAEKTAATSSAAIVTRKIEPDEIVQLQKEGRLKGYDPATRIGKVAKIGRKTEWPEGDPKAS